MRVMLMRGRLGCKKNDIDVVYTMWANLNKTANMDVGQVGFHNQREVRLLNNL
jgi:hypothetical protein